MNRHGAKGALTALGLCMLLGSLSISSANVALPVLATELRVPFQGVQWVLLAYLLASTSLTVAVGKLGDMIGRRRVLVGGIATFAVGAAIAGLAPSLALLVAGRAIQGCGAAAMTALSLAMAAELAGPNRTGKAMGLLATMSAVGTALGPSIGGLLIAAAGWKAIFLVNLPLSMLAALLACLYLPVDPSRAILRRPAFDWPGAALLGVTLAALSLAATRGGAVPIIVAAFSLLLFVRVERAAESPLVPLPMLRDPALCSGLSLGAAVSAVVMGALVVGPFYLSSVLQLGIAQVGLAMSVGPLLVAISAIPAGHIADRIGSAALLVAGLFVMSTGCALLAAQPASLGLAGFLAGYGTLTLGYAAFQTANNAQVMANAPLESRGAVSGMLSLSRNLGLILGASVMGAIFAAGSGVADIAAAGPNAVHDGMRVTFAFAFLIVTMGLWVAARLAIGPQSPRCT